MEKRLQDRYATAKELAEDLQRFLDDKPILARRPTPRERLRKWGRRHRQLVGMFAIVATVGCIGLGLSTAAIWQEQTRTRHALDEQYRLQGLADMKSVEAQGQRTRAQNQFFQLLSLTTSQFGKLQDKHLTESPEAQKVREEVLQELLQFFDKRVEEDASDRDVLREAGRASLFMGHVFRERGQYDKAEGYYEKSTTLLDRCFQWHTDNPQLLADLSITLAQAYYNRGLNMFYKGDLAGADEQFGKVETQSRTALGHFCCPIGLNNLAWFLASCPRASFRKPLEAVSTAKQALEIAPQWGDLWNTQGVAFYRAGRWQEALAAFDKSCQYRKGGDAVDYFFQAMTYHQLGQTERARTHYEKALREAGRSNYFNDPLVHFRSEAAELLGRPAPVATNKRTELNVP
jgi:tetratricopeptide (TPR) repeat protein